MKLKLPAYFKNSSGFTIIELLIVITVIGLLAGITLSITNSAQQRAVAEDAVKQANLSKVAEGLETFFHAEGFYPAEGSGGNPLDGTDGDILAIYIDAWPADAIYNYDSDVGGTPEFAVHIQKSTTLDFFKYRSTASSVDECDETTPDLVDACVPIDDGGGIPPPPPPTLVSVVVTPAGASVAVGGTKQYTATANYSDGSSKNATSGSTWQITPITGNATITSAGLATGTVTGSVTVKATYLGITGNTGLTITSTACTVTSINVTPNNYSLSVGQKVQMTATATCSGGGTKNVTSDSKTTWTVLTGAIPAISVNNGATKGLVSALNVGKGSVVATYSGVSPDSSVITVTSGTSCTNNSQCVTACGCSAALCTFGTCDCSYCAPKL